MKYYVRTVFRAILFLSPFSSMFNQKTKRIVFFGDSITRQVCNPGLYYQNRRGAKKKGIADQYELIGAGIGGNKVYDLYLRMEDDVLAKNPDIVVIWIGVNDVWHKQTYGTGTDPDKFEKFYNAIIKKLQAKNIRVISLRLQRLAKEQTSAINRMAI